MWSYLPKANDENRPVWWVGDSRATELLGRCEERISQLERATTDREARRLDGELEQLQGELEARKRHWHRMNAGADFDHSGVTLARHLANLPW